MKARARRRAAELLSYSRVLSAVEKTGIARLQRLFDNTASKAEQAYLLGGRGAALRSVEGFENGLAKILMPHYRRVYTIFGNRFFNDLKSSNQFETKDQDNVLDDFETRTRFYMSSVGGRKIQQISQSTRSSIMKAVAKGEANGEGVAAIATRIRQRVGGKIGKARANTIARTETHSAANSATFDAAESSGIEGVFEWMSIRGDRTRSTHRRADGQRRKSGNKFKVGGFELRFPGDPRGPAHEIINCRCALAFRPGKGDEVEGINEPAAAQGTSPQQDVKERLKSEYGVNVVEPEILFNGNIFGRRHSKENMNLVLETVEAELVRLKKAGYPDIAKNVNIMPMASSAGSWGEATGAFHNSFLDIEIPRAIALKAKATAEEIAKTHRIVNSAGQPWSVKSKDKNGSFIGTTFRHELGHTLTSPLTISRFREVAGRLFLKKRMPESSYDELNKRQKNSAAQTWFYMNLSEYSGRNIKEAIAEAFARYTAGNYVKGELPEELEELLEIMTKGKLPDRDKTGKIIGRDAENANFYAGFAQSDPIEGPKPGQRVVQITEEFDDAGNYIGDMQIREDEGLQFEDEPEVSFEDQLREELRNK